MALYRRSVLILVLATVFCGCFAGPSKEKPKRLRQGRTRVTLGSRVQTLEQKLEETNRNLDATKRQLDTLTRQVAAGFADTAPGGVPGPRFSDDPACPLSADFHYASHLSSCYHLEPNDVLVNWTEATAICRRLHKKANLVSIETETEQLYLQGKWQAERGIASLSRFWTSYQRQDGEWTWTATNKRSSYQNWIPTTTHDDDRFTCMAVYSNEAYYWGDVACWAPHLVTCEINL